MNKQIKEMANIIAYRRCDGEDCAPCERIGRYCRDYLNAEKLYNAGYRKVSDVARDVITEVIEILNEAYIKCNKWEVEIVFGITEKVAELKKKYESEGAE